MSKINEPIIDVNTINTPTSGSEPRLHISLKNLGTLNKNIVTLRTKIGSVNLYFSYETLVAVDNIVSVNDWSMTTGKLLNELEPDKDKRYPHNYVLKKTDEKINELLSEVE